jgi:hypothetical protein
MSYGTNDECTAAALTAEGANCSVEFSIAAAGVRAIAWAADPRLATARHMYTFVRALR